MRVHNPFFPQIQNPLQIPAIGYANFFKEVTEKVNAFIKNNLKKFFI